MGILSLFKGLQAKLACCANKSSARLERFVLLRKAAARTFEALWGVIGRSFRPSSPRRNAPTTSSPQDTRPSDRKPLFL